MNDLIKRQDVIVGLNKIVSTNPEDFFAHDKFIEFMDNQEIKSYGQWEWSNGYNTALVSMRIELDKIPTAIAVLQKEGKWIRKVDKQCYWYECSECGHLPPKDTFKQEWLSHFCPNCGARMVRGEEDDE